MGRPRLYTDEQQREKRRLKSQRWRKANIGRAREITRDCEKRRAAKRAAEDGREPGRIGRPPKYTAEEKRILHLEKVKRVYRRNIEKYRIIARERERKKRAAIRAGEYVYKPLGWSKLAEGERKMRDRALGANRRARVRKVGGRYTAADVELLRKKQHGNCPLCLLPLGAEIHVDHFVPIILGGSNGVENLRLLHPACNLAKGAQDPLDFAKTQGLLCW